jgi:hypothetical protein
MDSNNPVEGIMTSWPGTQDLHQDLRCAIRRV